MFTEKANATFNNGMFNCRIIRGMSDNANIHAQTRRLYQAAKHLRNIEGKSAVARLLNISPQNLNGWEERGISEGGLLKAQEVIGCNAIWLRDGSGDMIAGGGSHDVGLTATEISDLIILYEQADPDGRKAILDMAKTVARLADLSRTRAAANKFQ